MVTFIIQYVVMRQILIFYLIFFSLLSGCASRTVIVNNLPEREANEIVVLLNSKDIFAEKVAAPIPATVTAGATPEVLWNITVPAARITESLAILNRAGLPRIRGTSLLDLFGAKGLVPSELQDRIRYQEGLSEQLATTIRKMEGILDANVQITFPQEGESKELTASVYVKHRGILDNPNSLTITKIKRLVSSALPGLKIENVSVVTDRAPLAEVTFHLPSPAEEERYVTLWGVTVAKSSVTVFQLIFYFFLLFLFLETCLLGWMIWKFYPLTRKRPSFFFKPEQYGTEPPLPPAPLPSEETEG
jgi:type III secretion protein J